jgi:type II secretory pathway component PulM
MATEAKTPEAAHSPLDDPSLSREERQQHILMAHRNMRAQIAQLSQKIAELDSERGEHA